MEYATSVSRSYSSRAGRSATRIGVVEAVGRLLRGEPIVFVDARREEEWRRAMDKVPGAVRLPPGADETLPIIPAGHTAVVYCTCPGEASSLAAGRLLAARGYEDVRVLNGGLTAWRLSGGPTEPV
jgi:rhodanese-related sulfurtransferase